MTGSSDAPAALEGLRVVEVAEGVAAPYCAKLLADLGAEVIKVEPPGLGDACRDVGPFYHDEPSPDSGLLFSFLNTSKLGVTLDVESAFGRDLLGRIVGEADVLLVGGELAEIESRGLGPAAWRAWHPRLVCAYVTPFGLEGQRAGWRGGELVAFQMAGVGLVTPRERLSNQELPPLKAGGNQALMVAGLTAAVATLHALFARDATGEGQLVDVSEVEPLASFQFLNVARWAYAGYPGDHGYGEGSRRVHCRDGDVSFLLFTGQDQQWQAFRDLIGNPEWAACYDRLPAGRGPEVDAFWARLNAWAGGYTKEEVYRKAQALRVPLFPENDIAEAVESDQVRARGFVQEMPLASGATARAPVAPYAFAETPARFRRPAPALGRDNRAVFCDRLGLSEEELRRAYDAGLV